MPAQDCSADQGPAFQPSTRPVLQPAMPLFQPSSTLRMRWQMQCTAVYMPLMTASCEADATPCACTMPHWRPLNLMAAGTKPRK